MFTSPVIAICLFIIFLVSIAALIFSCREFRYNEWFPFLVTVSLAWFLFIGPMTMINVYKCFGGVKPDYQDDGDIIVYIADTWTQGFFWQTNEVRIYELHPYHERIEYRLSFPEDKKELAEDVHNSIGKYARITYRRWFIQPYRVGNHSYELLSVQPLSKEEQAEVDSWRLSLPQTSKE